MWCSSDGMAGGMDVNINDDMLEEECVFNYWGSHVTADGGLTEEAGYRVREVKSILRDKRLSMKAKRGAYEGVIAPTMLNGAETRGIFVENFNLRYPFLWKL